MIYSPPSSYYLVHLLLTIPGSCDQDQVIPVFLIHGISECVTIHESIQDSVILDNDSSLIIFSNITGVQPRN